MSILEKVKVLIRNRIDSLERLSELYCEKMDDMTNNNDHKYYEKELLINIEIRYELMDLLDELDSLD